MALFVEKSDQFTPGLHAYACGYAVVEIESRKGLRRFLGPRPGSVSFSLPLDSDFPRIRVVPPLWQKGQEEEWEILRQCYEQVLQLAARHSCKILSLPLLAAEDPNFPPYIDFKLAIDTIQAFLKDHDMDIHLLARRRETFQMPELRTDVEHFLSTHFSAEDLPWSDTPFADASHRFDTLAPPCPPSPAKQVAMNHPFISLPLPSFSSSGKAELKKRLLAVDAGFSETLLHLIDKSGKKDSEIYNRANVSRQHFSKIRNNYQYKPTKATAIAFAIALELNMEQTRDLIGRAGYALTTSSKFDLIIMYFIQNRNYDMYEINETLYEFDQILLGT